MRASAQRRAIIGPTDHRPNWPLVRARLEAGLSPNDLGHRAGVTGNTVRAAERGDYIEPRSQRAISRALDLDLLALFPIERQRVPR